MFWHKNSEGLGGVKGNFGGRQILGGNSERCGIILEARLQGKGAFMAEDNTRLTAEEVRHIALLARIGMSDEEVERMRDTLSDILAQFEALREVDTGGLEPTAHSVSLLSVMRDDEARDSLDRDDALANAPNRQGDLVRVKAVLE